MNLSRNSSLDFFMEMHGPQCKKRFSMLPAAWKCVLQGIFYYTIKAKNNGIAFRVVVGHGTMTIIVPPYGEFCRKEAPGNGAHHAQVTEPLRIGYAAQRQRYIFEEMIEAKTPIRKS